MTELKIITNLSNQYIKKIIENIQIIKG